MLQENLIRMYEQSFRRYGDMTAVTDYFSGETYTYYDFAKEIAKLHILFDEAGIKRGDKIALVGRNTPRWCAAYIATMTYGAVIVPIMQTFTPTDIAHIVNHSESRLLFLTDSFWSGIGGDAVPGIEAVFSLEDFRAMFEREGDKLTQCMVDIEANLLQRYPEGFGTKDIRYADVDNDQLILLNYTSGTTGYSKGVMLSVNNLTANVLHLKSLRSQGSAANHFSAGRRNLAFLPLAHAYGCAVDFLAPLAVGGHITLLGKMPAPKVLIEAMQVVKPHFIASVPLILEKIYRKQVIPLMEKGLARFAIKIPLLNRIVRSKMHRKMMELFGGNVELFIVGGAPINRETEAFLKFIGFPLVVGYGMTECAPLISIGHDPAKFKLRSCGTYLKNFIDIKIDSDNPRKTPGEILVKGECVMKGYYKNERDTNAIFDDEGWLHTGDMGTLDEDGTLYIKGRCKTMILTDNGQNVYPEQIEDKLNNLPFVAESIILENKGKLYGLVVPDFDLCEKEGVEKDELDAIMDENLRLLNSQVAGYERLARIMIFPVEFEKTPKRSVKRYLYDISKIMEEAETA